MSTEERQCLLVDLDVLLDTRLGTLRQHFPECVPEVTDSMKYWARKHEDWSKLTSGRVSNEMFGAAYAKRNEDTLKQSQLTGIIDYLIRIATSYQSSVQIEQQQHPFTLVINLHPYQLDDETIEALELTLLSYHFSAMYMSIEVVNLSEEELTPSYMIDNFTGYLTYNHLSYIQTHTQALIAQQELSFGTRPLSQFSLVGPLLFEKDPTPLAPEEQQKHVGKIKLVMSEFIGFDYIDPFYFSEFRKLKTEEETVPKRNNRKSFSM